MSARQAENLWIATCLREAAELLHTQGANPFRSGAYHRAADTVSALERPLREEFDRHGANGLQQLPGIGAGIAAAIAEMLITGRWTQLARLRGEADDPAAHTAADARTEPPSVEALLEVDREYRARAAAGRLALIAPKRFNPEGKAWLPVLHTRLGDWHFTALYSNTVRAHELGRTRDWVVIFFYDGDHREQQCTVVTETRGDLAGKRVVRGREPECRALLIPEEAV
jgi:hypothetical protein